MTPDDLREKLLARLYLYAPAEPGNLLENAILGGPYKPWYSKAWDYTRMGWRLITKQHIWNGEKTFGSLCGKKKLFDVGVVDKKLKPQPRVGATQPASVRPEKIEVFVVTCDVDNQQTLVLVNDLPENLNYFSEPADYRYMFRDTHKRIRTDHAGHASAALPCFERITVPHKDVLLPDEHAARVLDGAATSGLMTQIINNNAVPFLINLNESTETRSVGLDTHQKPIYQTGGLLNYIYNSFMVMMYNTATMDVRYALENGLTLEQYIELKPSMQCDPENLDMPWAMENPLTTLDFLRLNKDTTLKGFWFGYEMVKQRLDYIEENCPSLVSDINAKGVTLVLSGGGARGTILVGGVFAFIERYGMGVVKAMGGVSMGAIVSMWMADTLSICEDFCGHHTDGLNPNSPAGSDDRV